MGVPKVLSPEDLAPILHKTVETIKVDVRRRPESLPPRIKIPGSGKMLWLEDDVIAWLKNCRVKKDD